MADYIATIRRHIGHDLLLVPTTAFVLLNERDEILLMQRSDNGRWSLPGGILDIGETVHQSALREVLEETGLDVERAELFGIFAGDEYRAEYPNGDRTAVVQFVFVSRAFSGTPRSDAESTELRYFSLDALPGDIPPSHAGFLGHLPEWLAGRIVLPLVP